MTVEGPALRFCQGLCSLTAAPVPLGLRVSSPHLAKEGAQCLRVAISLPQQFCPGAGLGWAIKGMAQLQWRAKLSMLEHLWHCKDASWSWKSGLLGRCPVSGTLIPGCLQGLLSFPFAIPVQAAFGTGSSNCPLRTEGEVFTISDRFSDHNQM